MDIPTPEQLPPPPPPAGKVHHRAYVNDRGSILCEDQPPLSVVELMNRLGATLMDFSPRQLRRLLPVAKCAGNSSYAAG